MLFNQGQPIISELLIMCNIVKSLYNIPSYNMDFDNTTRSYYGSQIFLPWNFIKELKENNYFLVISFNSFVKLSLYNISH